MKRPIAALALAAAFGPAASQTAEPISLKGYRIGMTSADSVWLEEELKKEGPFTVGGVEGLRWSAKPRTQYFEGRLDELNFFFAPAKFEQVEAAMKEKYPATTCRDSEVQTRMGVKLAQRSCSLQGPDSEMWIRRYASDTTMGGLYLVSKRKMEATATDANKGKKDF